MELKDGKMFSSINGCHGVDSGSGGGDPGADGCIGTSIDDSGLGVIINNN